MVRIHYVLKNPEQVMVLKSYSGTATNFKAADTQTGAVGKRLDARNNSP
jgi:hypothetical protein